MKSNLIKINFYFPKTSRRIKSKQELINLIMEAMRKDGNIKYAGYLKEKDLQKDLLQHIGRGDINEYREISASEKKAIEKTIHLTIQKCHEKLPIPIKNFIFIFPWLPTKKDRVFRGSLGYAHYSCVLHLFIAPDVFTQKSLADSVAHEINHTISFYYHFDRYGKWSLLDHIINEGLAENFREEVLNTKPVPWAVALTKKEAFKVLSLIKPLLHSKNPNIHQKVLFGGKKYKRWTGYSIGYWLVKEFKKRHPKLSWEEIVKTKPEDILKLAIKNRAQ